MLTHKPFEGDEGVQALLAIIATSEQAQHDAHHWSCRDQGRALGPSRDPTLQHLSISHMPYVPRLKRGSITSLSCCPHIQHDAEGSI